MKNGTTTRIIDRCIQELFKKGFTFVYDGRGTEQMEDKTNEAFFKVQSRLEAEHPNSKYHYKKGNFDGIECYKIETHNL